MAHTKPPKKGKPAKQLTKLLSEHLGKFSTEKQAAMHEKFEKRLASRRDSESKRPSPLRAEAR